LLQAHLLKCGVLLQPGVIDQDIDRAEALHRLAEHRLHLISRLTSAWIATASLPDFLIAATTPSASSASE
jgi:hypothetical protein